MTHREMVFLLEKLLFFFHFGFLQCQLQYPEIFFRAMKAEKMFFFRLKAELIFSVFLEKKLNFDIVFAEAETAELLKKIAENQAVRRYKKRKLEERKQWLPGDLFDLPP